MARKLFCEYGPLCYAISVKKEIFRRSFSDAFSKEKIAKDKVTEPLPNIVKSHSSLLMRKLVGVDEQLQINKITNLELAGKQVNGLIIHPGETFSFWKTVGEPKASKGYREGLVILRRGKMGSGVGGGLCQLANMIHYLVLNSPLTVKELHHHTDALFPDERRRVPFGTGTSVLYNYVDYRFKNETNQSVQLLIWLEEGMICGELRSERPFPYRYRLTEEDHHFQKEGNAYYRVSKVYRLVIDRATGEEIQKEKILDNHSRVMYDEKLIPLEEIRQYETGI